jgi:alpha-L-fucosidase
MITVTLLSLLALGTAAIAAAQDAKPAPPAELPPIAKGSFTPDWESLKRYECPEWFRDAKFGIWAHWGPQCVPMVGDWYAKNMYVPGARRDQYEYHVKTYGHPSKFGYKEIIPMWKAEKFDPDRLMQLYKAAGARYFVSMGVHHDNFDLWNSKHHRGNAVQMGPQRDIVGDWQKAARKYGLRFGVSEHLGASFAWFQTSHGSDKTGPLAGVPSDGANPKWEDQGSTERQVGPHLLRPQQLGKVPPPDRTGTQGKHQQSTHLWLASYGGKALLRSMRRTRNHGLAGPDSTGLGQLAGRRSVPRRHLRRGHRRTEAVAYAPFGRGRISRCWYRCNSTNAAGCPARRSRASFGS